MALTTITGNMVSVNAIQGTLIADNAITAVHIASNAVTSIHIAENNVTAREIASNSITVAQLADASVESDKIANGVITTNHLNSAMISSQTEVTAVAGDFVLLGDTSDSNNLKKAPVSSLAPNALPLAGGTMTGTIAGFTSTGIDDNATSTAITIDSSENVGIGTTSPQNKLHVNAGTGGGVTLEANANVDIDFRYRSGGVNKYNVAYDASAGSLIWYDNTANATRMALDSSGILLVGKTADNNAVAGVALSGSGIVKVARTDWSLLLNRLTTNGELALFQKDGTTVGSIGTVDGDIVIGTGTCGVRFHDGTPAIQPRNSNGTANNDAIDIGLTGNRFKDLYLSGFAFVGTQVAPVNGTATTPAYGFSSDSNTGMYRATTDTLAFTTAGSERLRIASAGQIGIGGANYGTDGQILTSTGATSAPAWEDAPASGPSKGLAIVLSMIF